MVSFQCDGCGDIIQKKKLGVHRSRCWNTSFSCLDCMTQFFGDQYQAHTSCVTEAQKYHGPRSNREIERLLTTQPKPSSYRDPIFGSSRRPLAAYVTEVPESPNSNLEQTTTVNVPPPAPTPPPAGPPVNVFDFLVADNSPTSSYSSDTTSATSHAQRGSYLASPELEGSVSPRGIAQPQDSGGWRHTGYEYGVGPVETSSQKFDSEINLRTKQMRNYMQSADEKTLRNGERKQATRTPAPKRNVEDKPIGEKQESTDKKRKRPQVEELDISRSNSETPAFLHSGLTGGLTKLLTGPTMRDGEASPLSPKKRSKHDKSGKSSRPDIHDSHRTHRDKNEENRHRERTRSHRAESNCKDVRPVEGRADLKMVKYQEPPPPALMKKKPKQLPGQSSSEFFLGLIDADYYSDKGQSIWGALKTFHEGLYAERSRKSQKAPRTREQEEKKLFRGLRMKINNNGEIVLFARPDREHIDSKLAGL